MHSSFLFGTIHIARTEVLKPIAGLTKYLQSCQLLALELDLDQIAVIPALASPCWKHQISQKGFSKLESILAKAYDIKLSAYVHIPPMMIMQKITECILTPDALTTVDRKLWDLAGELGLEKKGLETLSEQMNLMMSIPMDDQIQMIIKAGKHLKANRRHHNKLLQAYNNQDIQFLYQSSKKQMGKYKKAMIYQRNKRMAERLADLHRLGPTFAGVGAAHLDGKFGCLAILKRMGFQVHPLPNWKY